MSVTDANGRELVRADRGPDNEVVPDRMANRAGLVGAIHLLQDIARKDDNLRFRQEAGKMAEALKKILKRLHTGQVISTEDLLGSLQLPEPSRGLPEPPRRLGNDVVDV